VLAGGRIGLDAVIETTRPAHEGVVAALPPVVRGGHALQEEGVLVGRAAGETVELGSIAALGTQRQQGSGQLVACRLFLSCVEARLQGLLDQKVTALLTMRGEHGIRVELVDDCLLEVAAPGQGQE
jgi:hypothetical protein